MQDSILFSKSVRGASHILTGKPCQDYSIVYQNDDIKIVVVCDGHGGNTYFRSDVGAKLAAETTVQLLCEFVRCVPSSTFTGIEFSITAQPKKNPFIDADGNIMRFDDLSEGQKQLAIQAQAYIESEGKFPQQQGIVKDLLAMIHRQWMYMIEQDARNHPFDKKEKKVLSGLGIEKAYGCTLLAFLQTKDYWLSFHIGDGKIFLCDKSLNWSNPVPEDCTCFLNYTTSLCDSNPLIEFRYAFNGKGEVPLAVMLCTDGLDGSLRTNDNIQDFYEQVLSLGLDGDDIESELEGYLPSLSESGNKDDVSLAGIITLSFLDLPGLRKKMEITKCSRNIRNEYRNKKTEIESIKNRIDVLTMKYERTKDTRFEKQTDLDEIRQLIKSREKEVSELDKTVDSLRKEIEEMKSDLKNKETDFDNWKFTVKNDMAELESAQSGTATGDDDNHHTQFLKW